MATKTWIKKRRQHWQDLYKMKRGCASCGYNKHPRALSFDHIDPSTKHPLVKNGGDGTKTKAGGMWQLIFPHVPLKTMIAEWRKCKIKCMNCHMEEKYHYVDISKYK